tara:strand:- start:468 stop:569 length:102 start_codon:yes stop_codon:yes gene_type:complete
MKVFLLKKANKKDNQMPENFTQIQLFDSIPRPG